MTMNSGTRKSGVSVDKENREKDDFYPTPPEATEKLLSVEKFEGAVWEPACGDGAISKVLEAHGLSVISTDLVDRGYGEAKVDFLMQWKPRAPNIITNPPFKHTSDFMLKACVLTEGKVAMLLRLSCLEGRERRQIFETTPLARVWVFSKRITMSRSGIPTAGSGMVAFAWFIFDHSRPADKRPEIGWI